MVVMSFGIRPQLHSLRAFLLGRFMRAFIDVNSERGRVVPRRPTLERYDNAKPRAEHIANVTADIEFDYKRHLVLGDPPASNPRAAYAELVRFGVNGEVPLAQAMVNAGLVAANDNEQRRLAA